MIKFKTKAISEEVAFVLLMDVVWVSEGLVLRENKMIIQTLLFYLNRNQSHGQIDEFLRKFLLKLNLCRPNEDLSGWEIRNIHRESIIELFQKSKNLKIFILDRTDSTNQNIQNCFVNERIEEYKRSLQFRERLIFIELIDDSKKHFVYQLIENKCMIEHLQLRKEIEIKDLIESFSKDLENENWFKAELNNYLRELEKYKN